MLKLKKLSIILFAYNEQGNLKPLLGDLVRVLDRELPECYLHFSLCIQGEDNTLQEVKSFFSNNSSNNITNSIQYSVNPMGIRNAFILALENADPKSDAYLTMDSDLNHSPEDLADLLKFYRPDSIVVGSRFCKNNYKLIAMPHWKLNLSRLCNALFRFLFLLPLKDNTSGYRLISSKNILSLAKKTKSHGFSFYPEFLFYLINSNIQHFEVPISFTPREHGKSKMYFFNTSFDYLLFLFRMLFLRFLRYNKIS